MEGGSSDNFWQCLLRASVMLKMRLANDCCSPHLFLPKKNCQMQKRQASKEIDTLFVTQTKKVSTIGGTQHF